MEREKKDINPSRRYVLIRKVIPSISRGSKKGGRKKRESQTNDKLHHQAVTMISTQHPHVNRGALTYTQTMLK